MIIFPSAHLHFQYIALTIHTKVRKISTHQNVFIYATLRCTSCSTYFMLTYVYMYILHVDIFKYTGMKDLHI